MFASRQSHLETVTYNRERTGDKLGQPDLTWASFWFDNNKLHVNKFRKCRKLWIIINST
jgi:hypothetical protein